LHDRALGVGAIGFDTADAKALLDVAAPRAALRPADDFMLNIRMIKTPAEIELLRKASVNNVEAAPATAKAARGEGTLRNIRQRFFAEAARRGNVGVYGWADRVLR
jgi:Xaa-Pro aminopeptidase